MQLTQVHSTQRHPQLVAMATRLAEAGCATPRLDARLLLQHALAGGGDFSGRETQARCDSFMARRAGGEPVSRILGVREFWSLPFKLTPACLDPRPDSETLVEAALECLACGKLRDVAAPFILDYGTGSGCLLIAILHECQRAHGIGLDCAADAIVAARANAAALGVAGRAVMLTSHWCDGLDGWQQPKADVIVANVPYIPSDDIADLAREVRLYDPRLALDGGEDGFEAWREVLPRIKKRLATHGHGVALCEIGVGQKSTMVRLAKTAGLVYQKQWCDLTGRVRVLAFGHG